MSALVAAGLVMFSTGAQGVSPSPNLTARDAEGHLLLPNPRLEPGDVVALTVSGFTPRAAVTVRLARVTAFATAPADAHGVLRYRFQVPAAADGASRLLTFSGAAPKSGAPPAIQSTPGDGQAVAGVVPTIGLFPYVIGPANHPTSISISPSSASPPTSPPASQGGGTGSGSGPARTGLPLEELLLAGAALVALGSVLSAAYRRGRAGRRAG